MNDTPAGGHDSRDGPPADWRHRGSHGIAVVCVFVSVLLLVLWAHGLKERQKAVMSAARAEKAAHDAEIRAKELRALPGRNEKHLHEASVADYMLALRESNEGDEEKWRRAHGERLAHLARALDWEPTNIAAASRLWSTLATRGNSPRLVLHHGDQLRRASFSPDGSKIVTMGDDHITRLWDAATGKPFAEPLGKEGWVYDASFSPDGSKIVIVGDDYTARVWDAATGKPLGDSLPHEGVLCASFSPDGAKIVTGSADQTAQVWDVATRKPLGEPLRDERAIVSANFSPDGSNIFTVDEYRTVHLWNATSGKPFGKPFNLNGWADVPSFSLDGSRIVAVSDLYTAFVWDASTGEALGELLVEEQLSAANFSPDGTRIVTSGLDYTALVWNPITRKVSGQPMRHGHVVNNARFSPDGAKIVTSGADLSASVWDARTNELLSEPLRHPDGVNDASFSPDSAWIVTACVDGNARVWEATASKPRGVPLRHPDQVNMASFSPDGLRIVTASDDHTARIWNALTGKPVGEPLRHGDKVHMASFNPDGSKIVTASDDHTARIWDATTGEEFGAPLRHNEKVYIATFSPNGLKVVTASDDHTALVWDAVSGKKLSGPLQHEENVSTASFSPDGARIVTAGEENIARVWDAATGRILSEAKGHKAGILSASFSPDGSKILTDSWDYTIRVWDAATGKELGQPVHPFPYRYSALFYASFSPDSAKIATLDLGLSIQQWDSATGKLLSGPLLQVECVDNAIFTTNEPEIVTSSWGGHFAKIWDAATGKPFSEFLRHEDFRGSSSFSPDGSRIVVMSNDRAPHVWDVSTQISPGSPVPEWARDFARAIAGHRFDAYGELTPIPSDECWKVIHEKHDGTDAWSRLAQWMETPRERRTINPDSKLTYREVAESERDTDTWGGLESALDYDPTVPLARLMLARFEENPQRAEFLRKFELQRMPENGDLWLRAANALGEQEGQEALQLETARHAAKLSGDTTPVLRALARALSVNHLPADAMKNYETLLTSKDATSDDFGEAGYLAAQLKRVEEMLDIFARERRQFPKALDVFQMEGKAWINLGRPAEAVKAFQQYEFRIDSVENPPKDHLAGLAISLWLAGDKQTAVADYQRLIAMAPEFADPKWIGALKWPEAEKRPLGEVFVETLKQHPELRPALPAADNNL